MSLMIKLNDLKQLLKRKQESIPDLYGWEISEKNYRSLQRLYQSDDMGKLFCHQDRVVEERSYSLTIYSSSKDSDQVGIATKTIMPHLDLDEQINETIRLSESSKNKKWTLPEKPDTPWSEVITADRRILERGTELQSEIESRLEKALMGYDHIHFNSAELYLNYSTKVTHTHTEIEMEKDNSDIYFEIAMERDREDLTENDKEVLEMLTTVSYDTFDLEDFLESCADQVTSLTESIEPETTSSMPIIIDSSALAHIFKAPVTQLSAANEFHKMPFLEEGTRLADESQGDNLTLSLNPYVESMADSTPFTREGLPSEKAILIEENVVIKRPISNRYGQYLGKVPNGICGNIVVNEGSSPKEEFYNSHETVLDIISFSSLLVDQNKLTWSSEIKLGKLYQNGKFDKIIKGGVVSGNIRENLSHMILSKEIGKENDPGNHITGSIGYLGPEKMLIMKGVTIAGK